MSTSRQLAAIMFTDIVGYTTLMGKDSKKAMELVRLSKDIQKPLVEKHHGKWIKEMGDGAMAQFSTALDAVKCAVEIQESARAKFDGKLRIGIHSGDITIDNDDVYGDGVNVASRLESIADPGGIYISDSIEKAIRGQTDVQAKLLGEVKLKNVDYDVKTYAVQGVGLPVPEVKEKELTGHFWAELHRRGVLRAGATYVVLSLLLILSLPYASSMFDLPEWSLTVLLILLIIGFPIAMYLAWKYERSPEGFVRTTSEASWQNPYTTGQRKPLTSNLIIAGMAIIIVGMYAYPRYFVEGSNPAVTAVGTTDNSIAVLYFDNMSGDPNQEYFSDGMTEEIIAHLSRIRDLDVRSRTSVLQYKTKRAQMNLREIAEELGVKTILEGSVRKSGDQIRVSAQLIDAATDEHLWSETYDEELKEIFEVQSSIARQIAQKFDIKLEDATERRLNTPPTQNIAAYDLFLQAQSLGFNEFGWGNPTPLRDSAAALLRQVLKMDPTFSRAYSMLSRLYTLNNRLLEIRKNWVDSAVILAQAAITHDPDNPFGYLSLAEHYRRTNQLDLALKWYLKANEIDPSLGLDNLGWAYLFRGDYVRSVAYFHQTIIRSPSDVSPYVGIGRIYWNMGMMDSARAYMDRAQGVNPEMYFTFGLNTVVLVNLYGVEEASDQIKQSAVDSSTMNYYLGIVYFMARDFDKARELYLKSGYRDLDWGLLLMKDGLRDSSVSVLERSIEYRMGFQDNFAAWNLFDISRAYGALGDLENFMKYARLSFELGWHEVFYLDHDPMLDRIRDTPEFKLIRSEFDVINKKLIKEVSEAVRNPEKIL